MIGMLNFLGKEQTPAVEIRRVAISDLAVDDLRLKRIFEVLSEQTSLSSITLKNCELGKEATPLLAKFLGRAAPKHLSELRLENVRGAGQ